MQANPDVEWKSLLLASQVSQPNPLIYPVDHRCSLPYAVNDVGDAKGCRYSSFGPINITLYIVVQNLPFHFVSCTRYLKSNSTLLTGFVFLIIS